jgi:hypothetical protein
MWRNRVPGGLLPDRWRVAAGSRPKKIRFGTGVRHLPWSSKGVCVWISGADERNSRDPKPGGATAKVG